MAIAVILAAYCLSLLLHLIIAELSAGDGSGKQIIELLDRYLFTGKGGKTLTWVLFVLMGLAFLANLAAYIAGGREVFAGLGIGNVAGSILFYALAQAVRGLADRPRLIVPSVATGLGINLAVILVVILLTLAVPGEVTTVATIGWRRHRGAGGRPHPPHLCAVQARPQLTS